MPLGKEVDLVSGDIVLDGDSAPTKGHSPCTIFGPRILWPNGWMDQDAVGTEVGRGPGYSVLDAEPAPPKGAHQPSLPVFSADVYCGGQTVAHLSYC